MMRRLLIAVALGAAGLATATAPAAATHTKFSTPLPIPEQLTGSDIEIPMKEAEVQLLPGQKTRMWTYGGTFPGPTIRRPSGRPTRVTFTNDLPASAGSMTVHHHGAQTASSEDGQPEEHAAPGGLLIPPGGRRTYTWDFLDEGKPERAAFQWYHDHRMDVTGRNVWNGLAGMFILEDDFEKALPLPQGEFDVPLMVVDRSFNSQNQLVYPQPIGLPPSDEVVGDHVLVNGAPQPHFDVGDRRYRLRLLNASNFRTYTFSLSGGLDMTQIGTESGLLPAPVKQQQITLGPAERAEVVVDFAGRLGQEVVMTSAAGDVMKFRVTKDVTDDSSVPAALRPAPALSDDAAPDRVYNFGLGFDPEKGRAAWTINGQVFDHERADAMPKLGSTETWMLTNTSSGSVPHLIHIHGVDWQIVSRNGQPPPPEERGLKETVRVDPREVVVVRAKFTDHAGFFVFHCHMLEHEDNGMMAQYKAEGPEAPKGADSPPEAVQRPGTEPRAEALASPAPPAGPAAAADAANVSVELVRAPRRLRTGARIGPAVRLRNRSRVAVARTRVVVTLPRDLRRVVGGRARRGRTVVLKTGRLRAGATRTLPLRLQIGRRLTQRRLRLSARLVSPRDAVAADDSASIEYRLVRRRGRTFRAGSAPSKSKLLCVLDQGNPER